MITWSIVSLEVQQGPNDLANVVNVAHWRASVTDAANEVYSYGSVPLVYNEQNTFIPFENLSEETVLFWVKAAIGQENVGEIEARILAQASSLTPSVSPSLPWS